MVVRRRFLGMLASAAVAAPDSIRFAVLPDVQYADQPDSGKRRYRDSLRKLEQITDLLSKERPAFTVQTGDLVDGGVTNTERILALFDRLPGPRYHVLGNHDFFGPRSQVLERFRMSRAYYDFRAGGWHFVVLDGMQVAVRGGWPEDSTNYRAAQGLLASLKQRAARNANDWNGALGGEQLAWLRRTLGAARRRNERSIVFCHFPALAASCRPDHLLWDHEQVLEALAESPSAAAYICGHDHNGGYAEHNGVHHITMPGIVEHEVAECPLLVEAGAGNLTLRTSSGERREYSVKAR